MQAERYRLHAGLGKVDEELQLPKLQGATAEHPDPDIRDSCMAHRGTRRRY